MVIQVTVIRYLPEHRIVWPLALNRAGTFKILDQKIELSLNPGRGFLDILQSLFLNEHRILHTVKLP